MNHEWFGLQVVDGTYSLRQKGFTQIRKISSAHTPDTLTSNKSTAAVTLLRVSPRFSTDLVPFNDTQLITRTVCQVCLWSQRKPGKSTTAGYLQSTDNRREAIRKARTAIFYHALVSIRIFHALFHVFSTRVRVMLLTLAFWSCLLEKKVMTCFTIYLAASIGRLLFLSQRQTKSNIFTRHLANQKNLFNKHKNLPQNLSLIFRLFSFFFAVSLSILHKTLHFCSHSEFEN